ncbi:MAG: hypothetical protein AAF939_12325 [Planctomycetota bacterium]
MLMALLYNHEDELIAAGPACDQLPLGDRYWLEFHESKIGPDSIFETAYVTVVQSELQKKLLMLGIDDSVEASLLEQKWTIGKFSNQRDPTVIIERAA